MRVSVPHPNHHQTLSCALCPPSTLHLVNHKQHHAFLHFTHQSITLLPQPSFLFLNVVFFTVIVLVIIECTVVMECITRLHQSSTQCVCATLVPSSVVITLFWCFGCGVRCSPRHCASHMHAQHLDSG